MNLAFHFDILPNKSQVNDLEFMFNIGKEFWNWLKSKDESHYLTNKKSYSQNDFCSLAKEFKHSSKDTELLNSHLFQDLATRYYRAKQNAFRKWNKDKSKKLEFPKLKDEEHTLKSLLFKQYGNGCKLDIENKTVKFNHLIIKIKDDLIFQGNVKTIQIKKFLKGYKLILSCDNVPIETNPIIKSNILNNYKKNVYQIRDNRVIKDVDSVGIDVGIRKLATCSNGTIYKNPRHIKKHKRSIQNLKRRMDRQIKGSNRHKKTRLLYQKKHEKVRNIRKDYLHKISKHIVLTCGTKTIIIEDLNIKSILESEKLDSRTKKNIFDASWDKLSFYLKYKCEKYGKRLIEVNPAYTSKTCSKCKHIHKNLGSKEKFKCPNCRFEMNRDLNASINIKILGTTGSLGSERPNETANQRLARTRSPLSPKDSNVQASLGVGSSH